MNDYYICVRRFVVSDPELPDSLYIKGKQPDVCSDCCISENDFHFCQIHNL